MKRLNFLPTLAVAAILLFNSACNSGSSNKSETSSTTTDTSTATKEAPPAPPASPTSSVQGPKMIMTVTHHVSKFDSWKKAYESHDSIRNSYGLHNYVVARGIDDPTKVMVAMRMDDVAKAKELVASPGMKERMKKSGSVGPVEFDYLESVMNDTTAIQQTVRLMVKHKVKDWDAWKKTFDDHKQVRMDAGLTDRVVAHTVGDPTSVTIVFAVTDIAKAKAFSKSKDLKDRMAAAGVTGPPSFFFYKVVQKY